MTVGDKVTRQCHQTTTFEEKGVPKWNWAKALLTSLTLLQVDMWAKLALKPTSNNNNSYTALYPIRIYKFTALQVIYSNKNITFSTKENCV